MKSGGSAAALRVMQPTAFGGSEVREAIPLGRFAGFPLKVHWSVIVILWLFTWSLATTLPGTVEGYSRPAYWLAGACGALVLLASLLAHELAHAVVARRVGVSVGDVTLWLFGGVTTLQGEAKTPKAAFRIAVAGPATSLALSAMFGALVDGAATVQAPPIIGRRCFVVGHHQLAARPVQPVTGRPVGRWAACTGLPVAPPRRQRARGDRRGACRTGGRIHLDCVGIGGVFGGRPHRRCLVGIHRLVHLRSPAREEETRYRTNKSSPGVRVADAMTPNRTLLPDGSPSRTSSSVMCSVTVTRPTRLPIGTDRSSGWSR